jgi:hypothetical protein
MSGFCFVIQPFDKGGKFDKRYDDVFEPALKKAGIEPYRVDKDFSSIIPIKKIEERIRESSFCLADITTDNPNVWFEVGYAIAYNKDIILLCSDERTTDYPFDVRHRNVQNYKTESKSDFKKLFASIVSLTVAILNKPPTIIPSFNIKTDTDGLGIPELGFLSALLAKQDAPDDGVSSWSIKSEMNKSGLNEIAFSLAARKLLSEELIKSETQLDYNGNKYSEYYFTQKGNNWIIVNKDKFPIERSNESIEYDAERLF